MATFYNQATISLGGNVIGSNVTEGEVVTTVTMLKTAISTDYRVGDNIAYLINLINSDNEGKNGITVTDNLGLFSPNENLEVVPLTYVDQSVKYYVNGVLQTAPTVVAGPPLVISGINIPAGGNVTIIYEAKANDYAPRGAGAYITNTVEVSGEQICDILTDSATVPTRDEPQLSIAKAICPETVTCGNELTYTFIIQNLGNTAVLATDNLILTDTFQPPLNNITVRLNGTLLTEGVEYTYDATTGEFTTIGGAIPVPQATFVRDATTGIISTTPGVVTLTITGNI